MSAEQPAQHPEDPSADDQQPKPEAEVADIPDVLAEIETLQAQLKESEEARLRTLAESENIRKRAEKEKTDTAKFALTGFARDLLSVADTFSRALQCTPQSEDSAVKNFVDGIVMTEQELQAVFEKNGITAVNPQGEKFDHNLHQAMVEVATPDVPVGHVAQVMQVGYTLHGRLIRPALVAVAKEADAS